MELCPLRLSLENLVVDRGSKRVLDGITFSAKNGEAIVFQGANGSGKTTLLRTLAGLIKPVSGKLSWEERGQEMTSESLFHYIGHLNALKDNLSVVENLTFWAQYLGQYLGETSAERIQNALEAFQLERLSTVPAAYLSAGQKRRACLARLLVAHRPIWLLDEPTVSLDFHSVGLLTKIIEDHLQSGGLLLAATHLPLGLAQEKKFKIEQGRGVFL